MKTSAIAVSTILAVLVLGAAATTYAYSVGFPSGAPPSGSPAGGATTTTAGTSFTIKNLTGHWVVFTAGADVRDDQPLAMKVGNSTGTLTFSIVNTLHEGVVLTMTAGSFAVNGTTYTVSSGQVTLNPGGESGDGSGTASNGATFIINLDGVHGNITSGALVGAVRLDVKTGTSEYLVILGSHVGVAEDDFGD